MVCRSLVLHFETFPARNADMHVGNLMKDAKPMPGACSQGGGGEGHAWMPCNLAAILIIIL